MKNVTKQFIIKTEEYFHMIQPSYYGYGICKPLHTGGIRLINHWLLHYVVSGTGIFEVNGHVYHPKAGDMFIIRPDQCAFYAADEEDPWTYCWFDFYSDMTLPDILNEEVLSDARLGEVFLSTYRQGLRCPEEHKPYFLYGKLFELLGLLEKLYPSLGRSDNGILVHKARQYLWDHHAEHITIKDLARLVHMEPSHFVTLFRKVTGITPWNYLTNLRISLSCGTLLFDDLSVEEVAERVGYMDAGTFSHNFKVRIGMSPSEYIKKYRSNSQYQKLFEAAKDNGKK